MRGVGTNLAITSDRSAPILLDITRLVSRVGRGPLTGVDRVELAYLEWGLATDAPFRCLARLASGYVLLDRAGASTFLDKLLGHAPWGPRDLRARLGLKTAAARGQAEADLRRLAIAKSGKTAVPDIVGGGIYLNVGHANLTDTTLGGLARQGLQIGALVHDMIPLDFPEFQRPGTPEAFEAKMRCVARHADLVIANSKDTEARVRAYFDSWNATPSYVSAHLGLGETPSVQSTQNRPYYCIIGTIEPRKNHALLLEIWEEFATEMSADDIPHLHIIGQRGWNNEAVFSWLDRLKDALWLHEHNGMDDGELTTLLANSHGLLFPSFAEGFGLPSIEAARLGVPVICGDLAIHREVLADYPVYAGLEDRYLWKKIILEQANQRQKDLVLASNAKTIKIPTWSEHFDAVNAAVKSLA